MSDAATTGLIIDIRLRAGQSMSKVRATTTRILITAPVQGPAPWSALRSAAWWGLKSVQAKVA